MVIREKKIIAACWFPAPNPEACILNKPENL